MNRPLPTSTPVLRTTLLWSAAATALLAIIGAVVGFAVAGLPGLWSALVAIVMGALFLALTAASILIANRWFGDPLYVPIFFGAVMGGWLVKFVVFLVALFIVRDQPWLQREVFLIALVVTVLASLVIDVIVMTRMRMPYTGDVALPTAAEVEAAETGAAEAPNGPVAGGADTSAERSTPRD